MKLERAKTIRASARLGGWALVDQALSSGTNAALSIAAAHVLYPAGFGAFTLTFSTYLIALGLTQAITTSPLNLRFATSPSEERMRQMPACLGLAVIVGFLVAAVCAVIGLSTAGANRDSWLGIGVCLPGVLLQAVWRNQSFIDRNPRLAAAADGVWALVQATGFVAVFLVRDRPEIGALELLWGLGATISAGVFCWRFGQWPSPRRGVAYLREHLGISRNTAGEYVTVAGGAQAVPYVIAGIGSLAEAGVFRAGQLAVSFVNLPLQGVGPLIATTAVRLYARSSPLFKPLLVLASAGGAMLIAFYLAVLLALPATWGHAVIGSLWAPARSLFVPIALAAAGQWITTVSMKGLYACQSVGMAFLLRLTVAIISLPSLALAITHGGLKAAAWTLAASSLLGAVLGWLMFAKQSDSARVEPRTGLRPVRP